MASTFWNIPGAQSQAFLELLERSLHPICIYNEHGQTLYASPSFLALQPPQGLPVSFFDHFALESTDFALQTTLSESWAGALDGKPIQFFAKLGRDCEEVECSLEFNLDAKFMMLTVQKVDKDRAVNQLLEAYEQAIAALVRTEEKWKAFILNSPYLFIQTSNVGQIIYTSPAVEQTLGYQETELLGRRVTELIHPSNASEFERSLQLWTSHNQTSQPGIECWWKTKSGKWVSLYLQGQRFPGELEIDGIAISGYNISDRKSLESQLNRYKAINQGLTQMMSSFVRSRSTKSFLDLKLTRNSGTFDG